MTHPMILAIWVMVLVKTITTIVDANGMVEIVAGTMWLLLNVLSVNV